MGRHKKYNTEEERKAAHRESQKQYHQKHREEKSEYDKQYYQDHKDERAQYRKDHKEERAEYAKQYHQKHREEKSEYQKQYYQDNKEEIAECHKQYRQEHKEEIEEKKKQYRSTPNGRAINLVNAYKTADKKQNRGECTLTPKWIVDNVFSGQVCHYCGESDWTKLGVDRKDSSLPHTPENCVPCCFECNTKKARYDYDTFMRMIGKVK